MTMPNRVMAWATSSPSPWRDTSTCNGFGPGQPTGVIIRLPCHVMSINPVPWANKSFRKLPFVTCQIVVRSTSRTYWATENPIRARPNGVPKNRFPRPTDVNPPIALLCSRQCRVFPLGWRTEACIAARNSRPWPSIRHDCRSRPHGHHPGHKYDSPT